MEVKKFEAYVYRGPKLENLNRKQFLDGLIDIFTDSNFFGYTSNGTSFDTINEILYIYIDKDTADSKVIKLDLSDLGIEIGTQDWINDEPGEFHPEVNLDTETTKQMKTYRNDIKKFNI